MHQKNQEDIRILREQNDKMKQQLVEIALRLGPQRPDPEVRRPPPRLGPKGPDL